MSNSNLTRAKKEKNDEFYTQYADIEKELQHYNIEGKTVYCNCDNPHYSNFYKYFKDKFNTHKIKHLYCTGYNKDGNGYYAEYNGTKETIKVLNGNGSFDSDECINILKIADVIITNPPFSLFREYVKLLMEYGKKFLIIGNGNAVTYKEIFPYIKNNELWLGHKCFSGGMDFIAGNNYDESKCLHPKYDDKGNIIINVMMCVWFTNIGHKKRHKELDLYRKYDADAYPKYDNYDAIEVSRVSEIPMDYEGVMGVPITFLDKYCPSQFEIVNMSTMSGVSANYWTMINGKRIYSRLLIKRKQ